MAKFDAGYTPKNTDFITAPTGGDDSRKVPLLNEQGLLSEFVPDAMTQDLYCLEDVRAGYGLGMIPAGVLTGSVGYQLQSPQNSTDIYFSASSHYARYYQPFIAGGGKMTFTARVYRLDAGAGGSRPYYEITVKIYEYDGGVTNKKGTLLKTVLYEANHQMATGDEEIVATLEAVDNDLTAGTKYTLEFIFESNTSQGTAEDYHPWFRVQSASQYSHVETAYIEWFGRTYSPNNQVSSNSSSYYSPIKIELYSAVSGIKEGGFSASYPANFAGFVEQDYSAGEIATVKMWGVVGGFSGLTAGNFYQFNATTGAAQSNGTGGTGYSVGIAISSTELFVVTRRQS